MNEKNRSDIYQEIYQEVAFNDWITFDFKRSSLEDTVRSLYSNEEDPEMKLIGSAATKTVRKGREDLDYAVAFDQQFDNDNFLKRVIDSGLNVTKHKVNKNFGYLKVSGEHMGYEFVLVPVRNPNLDIWNYAQDAFYHSDFINRRKGENHSLNVILLKEFFDKIGVYKQVKGISCELMMLHFKEFDKALTHFAENDSLRVNHSGIPSEGYVSPLVVDYPFLGKRSFTEQVTKEDYNKIQRFAREVLENPEFLKRRENGN